MEKRVLLLFGCEHVWFKLQAGAGTFGNLFPFSFPFSLPCSNFLSINPWAPASTITTPPPGLLTFVNNRAVYSDVSICCGGSLGLEWKVWKSCMTVEKSLKCANLFVGFVQLCLGTPAIRSWVFCIHIWDWKQSLLYFALCYLVCFMYLKYDMDHVSKCRQAVA